MDFLTLNKVLYNSASGIKEGTINDLNAAKVSAMKAAEIGECCLSLLLSLLFSSVVALSQGYVYSSAGLDSSSVRWHISSRGRTGRDVLLWLPVDHKQGFHCIFALMKTDGRTA